MEIDQNFGNLVQLERGKEIYEGILLPSPENGIVLLKLENGYNIGFNKKEILKLKLLKKISEKEKDFNFEISKDKPNVAMVILGGTIAARLNPLKGGVDWLDTPESLFKFYPEIFEKVNVVKVEVPFMKASEDMDYKDWQKIARVVETLLNDSNVKGIIVTHGTDFLHYTSAALSFFLRNLNKPVVLTYSQRSIDRASSDANLNLQCSALVAISNLAEIVLVGHASTNDDFCNVMRGTKVRKLHASRRDAFKAVNDEPIARVYPERLEILNSYHPRNKDKPKLDLKFEEKVALVKVYPGQDPGILDYYLKNKEERKTIQQKGTIRALKDHTYHNRVQEVLRLYRSLK